MLSLSKIGTGTLTLAGGNSYTGGTTAENGTLAITTASALPAGSSLTVDAGGTFASSTRRSAVRRSSAGRSWRDLFPPCPNRERWPSWQRPWPWDSVFGGEGEHRVESKVLSTKYWQPNRLSPPASGYPAFPSLGLPC